MKRSSRKGFNKIEITGTLLDDERKIKDILDDDFRDWTYTVGGNLISLALRPNIEQQLRDQSVDQALETIRNRVDEFGVAEPTIQKEGLAGDKIADRASRHRQPGTGQEPDQEHGHAGIPRWSSPAPS